MSVDVQGGKWPREPDFGAEERVFRTYATTNIEGPTGNERVSVVAIKRDWPERGLSGDRERYSTPREAVGRRPHEPRVGFVKALEIREVAVEYERDGVWVRGVAVHQPEDKNRAHSALWAVDEQAIAGIEAGDEPVPVLRKGRAKTLQNEMRQRLRARIVVLPVTLPDQ